jgi:glyoxalase family protein
MRLDGIHHITAITGDAPRNVDFYTRVIGLRLVAKSVNQDDPTVYHLFYADEHAQPGADLTFFEYPRAIPGRPGAGMVHTILWRVGSVESLDFWAGRLGEEGMNVARAEDRVRFHDPEGMTFELLVSDAPDAPLIADHPEIPAEHAIRGFEGVRAYSANPERSARILETIAGGRRVDDTTWELRGDTRGGFITYDPPPEAPGSPSAGTVHHIAWGTTMAEHPKWADRLSEAGVAHSGIIDRHYFHSIYFREPSGVLFEIADDGPGFTVDGPAEELGRKIILPPRFEAHRERIEQILTPLPDPRADWPART